MELPVAHEPAYEGDRGGGRGLAVPLEDDLRANEERCIALGRQLHGPALSGPVAKARAPACEAEVVGVVVRRRVALGGSVPHGRAAEAVDARHPELGVGSELQLAFGAVLHGRLRVASSRMGFAGEKQLAAEAAAWLVEDGMAVGLGTGSTVAFLLPALARRGLELRCVATSPATERAARDLGLSVEPFAGVGALTRLDIAIDGADQVAPDGWIVKGGGGAHTREKAVAAAADRFVVVASSDKLVDTLAPPVPVELLEYGIAATLRRLGAVSLRDAPRSPDGGVIADVMEPFSDPRTHAARLAAEPGVVEHGLFPPELVSEVIVASGDRVETRRLR